MNSIVFLPRADAQLYVPAPDSVLISIYDRSEQPLVPQPGWRDILFLRFHDTDVEQLGLEVFSAEQARQVLDFAEKYQSVGELVVHCHMGHCRSAAVAIYLAEKYGARCLKRNVPVTWMTWRGYNKLVYRRLSCVDQGIEASELGAAFSDDEERFDG